MGRDYFRSAGCVGGSYQKAKKIVIYTPRGVSPYRAKAKQGARLRLVGSRFLAPRHTVTQYRTGYISARFASLPRPNGRILATLVRSALSELLLGICLYLAISERTQCVAEFLARIQSAILCASIHLLPKHPFF